MSSDYWADVFRSDGQWQGHGNSDVRSTHGDTPWVSLRRKGACFVGHTYHGETDDGALVDKGAVRICLWRK